jgi:glyoxylase-like metal-dependent hydrolase (beta-lactamase superfamily II)
MVDAPQPDPALIARLQELGGVAFLVFTHKDHTAFSREWAEAFPGLRRVLHAADVCHAQGGEHGFFPYTGDVEVQVAGSAPKPQPLDAEGDVLLVPLPGHTKGSLAVLYREHYLFTGDSLNWSAPRGHLVSSRLHCWGDWREQARSLAALLGTDGDNGNGGSGGGGRGLPFRHVLPGHGEPMAFASVAEAHAALRGGLAWMAAQPGGHTPFFRFFPWLQLRTTAPGSGLGAYMPQWLRSMVEVVVAPVGAPGTARRGRVYKVLQALVALWVLYRALPRLLRRLRSGGRARHCRLPYGAYLLVGGGTAAAKARAIRSSTLA